MQQERRGIQSIDIGIKILEVLASRAVPIPLREIAKDARITIGKAHPYMVSFSRGGFVTQTADGLYELGPLALRLGLVRLQRLDSLKEAAPVIEALAATTRMSVSVTVLGDFGPTVVKLEQPAGPLHIGLRLGSVMSLPTTATGKLFASFLPEHAVRKIVAAELQLMGPGGSLPSIDGLHREFDVIRAAHMASTHGTPLPGISAVAAPVFNFSGEMVLAVTVMGLASAFEGERADAISEALRAAAEQISEKLGYLKPWPALPSKGGDVKDSKRKRVNAGR